MPHTRDPRKKLVGAWLAPEEIDVLNRLAIKYQINRSQVLRELMSGQITVQKDTIIKSSRQVN